MTNLLIRGGLLLMLYYQHVNAISFVSPPTPKTCKFLQDGRYYSGKAAIAVSGKTCRSWSTNETFSAAAFGNTSWSDLRNYCRGPLINGETNMPDGPWCFTTEGAQYCDVPFCSEETFKSTRQCVLENGFMTYAGNATADEECLLWTDDLVQSQGFELWQFPGSYSWEEMVNYCRNPDNHPYPWCYSKQEGNNGKLKKLECQSIPSCSNRCRLTEASLEYVGKKDRSETRKPCVPAQLAIPSIFKEEAERRHWFQTKYVNDDYYINLTECRSYPDQLIRGTNTEGPVCYVEDLSEPTGIKEERCAIFFCSPPPGFEDIQMFFDTTEADIYFTEAPKVITTISAEVEEAWEILDNWPAAASVRPPLNSPNALAVGISMWSVTGFFLICLMALDCSSVNQCLKRCKKNSNQMSDAMKDLYGSRISLRNNQVSPDSSDPSESPFKQKSTSPKAWK